ncbi:ATP-binding protein [Schwartzia succinivorans]|uniref:ATP-dependent DNA helicase RecG n=1 Tax=Schwartzia succinivorans DSM 10502 TaxID=1123243 RepID=A0A1M4XAF1_9FIRM|nr:ATP-binding protein [Schwartzia succinivorans]SHE90484.1 ATP-dependent DNA helicase RecG [Schwartzia succinivorans DSM 10502]
MRETKDLEYKEAISNTFLKTVSAFANYGTGSIKFGIKDDGTIIGIKNPKQACLDIENRINDSIDPVPDYSLSIHEKSGVITLRVEEGMHKPYLYKAKAYKRNDSATIEVDRLELTRLVLEGENLSYEETPAKTQTLSFKILAEKLGEALHLNEVTQDTLKTLELYEEKTGYNVAGELLADENSFCGIDMVRFGDSISVLMDRERYEHVSVLAQYDKALALYRKYYSYEEIRGSLREKKELIPEAAFREAVANAIVHRAWDIRAYITVSMFTDRIEITSPGGLPKGMSREGYLSGGISILRNRIIANVFFRLNMIEQFGTGIRRINETYRDSAKKPTYEILSESIRMVLPVIGGKQELTEDENAVYDFVKGHSVSSSAVVEATGFGKNKTVAILKKLVSKGYIAKEGNGRGLKYFVK